MYASMIKTNTDEFEETLYEYDLSGIIINDALSCKLYILMCIERPAIKRPF